MFDRRSSLKRGYAPCHHWRWTIPCALLLITSCRQPAARQEARVLGGDPATGAERIREYGCGACHTIPGVRGARGLTGPPLTAFGQRAYIAGRLPNTPENLVQWIVSPQAVDPQTAMPATGADAAVARDMAAYLYSLQRGGTGPPHLLPASWLHALRSFGPF